MVKGVPENCRWMKTSFPLVSAPTHHPLISVFPYDSRHAQSYPIPPQCKSLSEPCSAEADRSIGPVLAEQVDRLAFKALPCGDAVIKKNPVHEIEVQPKIHNGNSGLFEGFAPGFA